MTSPSPRLHRPWLPLTRALLDAMHSRTDEPAHVTVARFLRAHRQIGKRDQRFIVECAWAEHRVWRLIDHALAASAAAGHTEHPWDRVLLVATHALGWPPATWPIDDAHRERLTHALETALATAPPPDTIEGAALRCGVPDPFAHALASRHGTADAITLLHALRERAPTTVRVATSRVSRDALLASLHTRCVRARPCVLSPWGLALDDPLRMDGWDAWARGEVELQDEGSQLLAYLADARPGDLVVDVCAGAGGKSLAFAEACGPTGRVVALESDPHRLERLRPRVERARSTTIDPRVVSTASLHGAVTADLVGRAQVVFVDAPCTGWGTLRRRPELGRRQSGVAPPELVALQHRLLAEAAHFVAPGGRLVWATCSLLASENEDIADAFDAHPAFRRVMPRLAEPVAASGGVASFRGPGEREALVLRPDLHGTDGFFLACWERTGEA